MNVTAISPENRPIALKGMPGRSAALMSEIATVAAMTAVFVLLWGYSFGTDDQAIHLAYIERIRAPKFLIGDPMLAISAQHPSVFFMLMAWLSNAFSIEAIYFGGYLLSVFMMLFGLRMLGRSLWPEPGWVFALMLAVCAVVPRMVAGGLTNFDPSFLPRSLSLGPLLIALALCVRGRALLAFAITGLVFLFHATTAAHTATLIWMACAFCGRERLRALGLGPILFLIAASPLLFMIAATDGSGIPSPAPEAWVDAVKMHFPSHHYETPIILTMQVLWGTLAVSMAILCSPWKGAGRMLAGFLAGIWLLLAAGIVGNNILRSPYTIHLHLFQVGRMLDYLALLSVIWTVYACFRRSKWLGVAALVPATTYIVSTLICAINAITGLPIAEHYVRASSVVLAIMAAGTLMVLAMRLTRPDRADASQSRRGSSPAVTLGVSSLIVGAAIVFGIKIAETSSHLNYAGDHHVGYPMMRWADKHLPADAVVMIPPYLSEPVASFRHYGRRRIVGSWKDGGEGTFDYTFQMQWVEYVHHVFKLKRPANTFDYPQMLERAKRDYHRMTTSEAVEVAGRYGASHIVRESAAPPLQLPQMYRDRDYAVYRVVPARDTTQGQRN